MASRVVRLLGLRGRQRASCARACSGSSSSDSSRTSSSGDNARGYSIQTVLAVGAAGVVGGTLLGGADSQVRQRTLPPSTFRACCDQGMTEAQKQLPGKLAAIVGERQVSQNVSMKGATTGQGVALAVVRPGSLSEAVQVLRACVAADVAIVPQGAQTGLTGGSVPRESECDRPNVIINMRRLDKILPLGEDGKQVLCFAGAGIFTLQERLKKEFNRDSHSVLGSIFLNPSVAAGVAFGSGGTQIHKGPVFTERALFCRIRKSGEVELVDTLGLTQAPGDDVMSLLDARSSLSAADMDPACKQPASWPNYPEHITTFDDKVSRYNADTTGIDCNRSEGKVMILATIHDTYPMPRESKVVWVACKDFATANLVKRKVALAAPDCMAKTCEYIERQQFDVIDRAGRPLIKLIEMVGMQNLGSLWNLKLQIENLPLPFADVICDKALYWLNPLFPESLPKPLMQLGREFDHHLLIEMAEFGNGELASLESQLQEFMATRPAGEVKCHMLETSDEKTRAMLFRFAVQPAFRTYCAGTGVQGLLIDYAMPKNFADYPELPKEHPVKTRCLCAHFGCNVYHESLMFGPEVDVLVAKKAIKKAIEKAGGKLPAEHGHGIEYEAPAETQDRWRAMDPTNAMNPGVGCTSRLRWYGESAPK
ncbi:unnamed protein product [Polarella glacialis]|uniref:FAD-binding PCMH-type domain-containing protein n=1 Tax=Polarella glacialis TaxID=89957 RepID=A0A813HEF5_POLGL|nr:unnamed protein product [Polarella glacialis]CAE8673998.1 unnamed protein product [Polarella glacialis]